MWHRYEANLAHTIQSYYKQGIKLEHMGLCVSVKLRFYPKKVLLRSKDLSDNEQQT